MRAGPERQRDGDRVRLSALARPALRPRLVSLSFSHFQHRQHPLVVDTLASAFAAVDLVARRQAVQLAHSASPSPSLPLPLPPSSTNLSFSTFVTSRSRASSSAPKELLSTSSPYDPGRYLKDTSPLPPSRCSTTARESRSLGCSGPPLAPCSPPSCPCTSSLPLLTNPPHRRAGRSLLSCIRYFPPRPSLPYSSVRYPLHL